MTDPFLTKKEKTIIRMIADDCMPIKNVARELNRSKNTINNQIRGIYRKMNVHSQAELCKKYHNDNKGLIKHIAPVVEMFPVNTQKVA